MSAEVSRRGLLTFSWSLTPKEPPALRVVEQRARPRAPLAGNLPRVAQFLPFDCLLSLGTSCSTCEERCPKPGALEIRGKTVVIGPSCDGCGTCADACPAPGRALLLVPLAVAAARSDR